METETWRTYKDCPCGNRIQIEYHQGDPHQGQVEVLNYSGEFRSRRWPNYVYCKPCGRRHALHTFKLIG